MLTGLQRWLMEETYYDMKLWIYQTVHEFQKSHGGDFYDLLAEANYIFVRSLADYNPKRSALTTFLRMRIWRGLQELKRQRARTGPQPARHLKKLGGRPKVWLPDIPIESFPNEEWSLRYLKPAYSSRAVEFLTQLAVDLGEDARKVVTSILNPDEVLAGILLSKNGSRVERRALRDYFTIHHKWPEDRVDEAFWSITMALTS